MINIYDCSLSRYKRGIVCGGVHNFDRYLEECDEDDMPKVKVKINGNIVEFIDYVETKLVIDGGGCPDKYEVFKDGLKIGVQSIYLDRDTGEILISLFMPISYVKVIMEK